MTCLVNLLSYFTITLSVVSSLVAPPLGHIPPPPPRVPPPFLGFYSYYPPSQVDTPSYTSTTLPPLPSSPPRSPAHPHTPPPPPADDPVSEEKKTTAVKLKFGSSQGLKRSNAPTISVQLKPSQVSVCACVCVSVCKMMNKHAVDVYTIALVKARYCSFFDSVSGKNNFNKHAAHKRI